ncbi:MAG: alpha-amylase family glycosyl hydrolase [Planctomycetota bacterium]
MICHITVTAAAIALAVSTPSSSVHAQTNPFADRPKADDIFYHIMPITWRDGPDSDAIDPNRFGDFEGIEAGLQYLDELGITAYWTNPVFPSPAYHGYQHGPGDQINPWFGTEADFLQLIDASHTLDIEVYIDYVVYGISHDSPWFQSASLNPSSPFDDWLAFKNGSNSSYTGYTFSTWNGDSVGFIHWDLRNPDVTDLVNSWGQKWLDPNNDGDPSDGIDGYRLDHVWEFYNRGEHPDGWGYDLYPFWDDWHAALKSVNPDVFTFAEQADWGLFGREFLPVFGAAFTKPFEFAARDALRTENATALYNTMAATVNSLPEQGTYMAIIGDHDVDRLSSSIGADNGANRGRERAAAAVLMLQPFPPVIYQGDEIGMLGFKANYGSDANDIPFREPFKWNASEGAPMTRYHQLDPQTVINQYSFNNDGRSVEEQEGIVGSLLETYRDLIALRGKHTALRRGDYDPIDTNDGAVWAFLRRYEQGEAPLPDPTQGIICLVNLSGSPKNISLDLTDYDLLGSSATVIDLVNTEPQAPITTANQSSYPVSISAYGYRVLQTNIEAPTPETDRTDGRDIPSDFGAAALLATQDTPTNLGDNNLELNQLFAQFDGSDLHVGVTGNTDTGGSGFFLFIDADPNAGVSSLDFSALSPPPDAPLYLTGTVFDAGFQPETAILANVAGGVLYVDEFGLSPSGFTKQYRGSTNAGSGIGDLAGGTALPGFKVAYDWDNLAGVTDSSAANANTATLGFELRLPSSMLGDSDDVRIMALLRPNYFADPNQVLPPVGGSNSNLDPHRFDLIEGDQFAQVPTASPCNPDLTTTGATLEGQPGFGTPDGTLDLDDLGYYLGFWLLTDVGVADVTTTGATLEGQPGFGEPDGTVDLDDLGFFLSAWLAGCT